MAHTEVVLVSGEHFRAEGDPQPVVELLSNPGAFVVLADTSGHKHWVRPEAVAEVREAPDSAT